MVLKLLIVEDDQSQLDIYESSIERYREETGNCIEYKSAKTIKCAIKIIDNTFDAAIVDLRLDAEGDEGNEIIKNINRYFRIPVVIVTGNPSSADTDELEYYKLYVRGCDMQIVLKDLYDVYRTGVTKIMGGRGKIEEVMNHIFWQNVTPNLDAWVDYSSGGRNTENALLRFVISHLLELLDHTEEVYFPEEMYISPPFTEQIKTGCIVKEKESQDFYIVLTPACDLALNGCAFKTDRVLACLIEKRDISIIQKAKRNAVLEIADEDEIAIRENKKKKRDRAECLLTQLPRNSYSAYYHYLPRVQSFDGGIINFRKIRTLKPKDFRKTFEKPTVQISSAFTKDIVARFSSYYARQGQPNFDFDELEKELKA